VLRALRALGERRERSTAAARFFTPEGYTARDRPHYFEDVLTNTEGVVHQPHVYPFAAYLAARYGCTHVIDLGCGRAAKLAALHPELHPVGVDIGTNVEWCRNTYPFGEWIERDFEQPGALPIAPELARRSVVVCADVIEHLVDPTHLLGNLRRLLEHAPVALLSTPDRELVRGPDDAGPPANPHHVREWTRNELARLLESAGLRIEFGGLTAANDQTFVKSTALAVLAGAAAPPPARAPDSFKVVAGLCVHNEADVLESTIRHLVEEGIEAYVLDNWSTDGTGEILERFRGRGVIGTERFPADGPKPEFDWHGALSRFEELPLELACDWFLHVDADERRLAPWPRTTLRDALHHVDRSGFNCVDHTVLVFQPVEAFPDAGDPEQLMTRFEFGRRPGHFLQNKAWKNLGVRVEHAASGGHDTRFEGRRVYPYKFLLKHYPIRSQDHGIRKVFGERLPRWSAEERARGWHVHYDKLARDHAFVGDSDRHLVFDDDDFAERFLVERLSGIGVNPG
jgi:SAM-dependent methyltransferase